MTAVTGEGPRIASPRLLDESSLFRLLQRATQPADDDAARAVVGRGADLVVDVEHELRHLVVPVEMRDGLGREPAPVIDIENAGLRGRELVDVVQYRLVDL